MITFIHLPTGWKEKKIRNYHRVWKFIRALADFARRISLWAYKTYLLLRISIENGFTSCLKGSELIVSRVTRVKLSNQTWWAYKNHNRAMHKDFNKQKKPLLRYLCGQIHPYFCFSFSVQLVRLRAYEDFYNPLPQMVYFPLFLPRWK